MYVGGRQEAGNGQVEETANEMDIDTREKRQGAGYSLFYFSTHLAERKLQGAGNRLV